MNNDVDKTENTIFISLRGYYEIRRAIEHGVSKKYWEEIKEDRKLLNDIAYVLTLGKTDEDIIKQLRLRNVPDSVIDSVLDISFSKFNNLSIKALEKILPFSKRIWQVIIKQKLYNQGKCLEILGLDGYNFLYNLSDVVESGDKGNREAIGAKHYFKCLFGEGFTRDDANGINSALNYGYTIMRGAVARTLVMYGFNATLGVKHCHELN